MGHIGRRLFLITAGVFLVASGACLAQQPQTPQRIGFLTLGTTAISSPNLRNFADGLRERGLVEGRDFEIDARYAEGRPEALAQLASELSARRPKLILAPGTVVVEAVRKAAPGIPVVTLTGDMSGAGLVAKFSRPGIRHYRRQLSFCQSGRETA